MELISTTTVGAGGAATIEFSSIPATYDDLVLKLSLRGTDSGTGGGILRFNTGGTYSTRRLLGDGSTRFSDTGADNFLVNSSGLTASTFANGEVYIPNYRGTAQKSFSSDSVQETNATLSYQMIAANLWSETAAITGITIDMFAGNFVEHSSASLYGIRKFNTSTQPKATGGAISYDAVNNKWVHVFSTSGTFTPTANITCEYLVVAGGGGGNQYGGGGGGGAGGYRSSVAGQSSGGGASAESALSLTSGTGYTVTIGAGGSAGGFGSAGGNGSNSVFSTITATAGAGAAGSSTGATGGSGGGQYVGGGGPEGAAGAGTANQGFAGGNAVMTGAGALRQYLGGGGGGGGAVGVAALLATAGNGGVGVSSNITGTAVFRAGGGGGGASRETTASAVTAGVGGNGGGGNGASTTVTSSAGLANSGGGGGGGNNPVGAFSGAAGGSGIVIVRYDA